MTTGQRSPTRPQIGLCEGCVLHEQEIEKYERTQSQEGHGIIIIHNVYRECEVTCAC